MISRGRSFIMGIFGNPMGIFNTMAVVMVNHLNGRNTDHTHYTFGYFKGFPPPPIDFFMDWISGLNSTLCGHLILRPNFSSRSFMSKSIGGK